jgi:hypothetical protein
MRTLILGALALLLFTGCIVVHEHPRPRPAPPPPPPPPPATTVTVTYGWNHHRYVVWTEYYYCSDDEVYWLENCGYDDDDILVCLYIARHSRRPLRYVFYEYDRCGRNLYTVSMVCGLPVGVYFYSGIPRGYACPPPYGRCYGYYWRNEHYYYSNVEMHALVHLQIGVRYYGYSHVTYFDHHHRGYQRNDPHPFRTIVIQDHRKAGYGGRTCDDKVIVKKDRPWDHSDVKQWERQREAQRQQIKVVHTPQKEREEQEKVKREAERPDRREAAEQARFKVDAMKKIREESDRKNPEPARPAPVAEEKPGGPARTPPGQDEKPKGPPAETKKGPDPEPRGPEKKPQGPPDRKPVDEKRGPPPQENRGGGAEEKKGPPPQEKKGPPPQENRGGGAEEKKGPPQEKKGPPPQENKGGGPKGNDSKANDKKKD